METGIVREVGRPAKRPRPRWAAGLAQRASAVGEKLDRLMTWVVGVLLVAVAAGLIGWRVSP